MLLWFWVFSCCGFYIFTLPPPPPLCVWVGGLHNKPCVSVSVSVLQDGRCSEYSAKRWLPSSTPPQPSLPHGIRTTDFKCSPLSPTVLPHTLTTLFRTFCLSHSNYQTNTHTKMLKLVQYNSGRKCVKQQY